MCLVITQYYCSINNKHTNIPQRIVPLLSNIHNLLYPSFSSFLYRYCFPPWSLLADLKFIPLYFHNNNPIPIFSLIVQFYLSCPSLSLLLLLLTTSTLDYDPVFTGKNSVEWLMAQVLDSDRPWWYVPSSYENQSMCLKVFKPLIYKAHSMITC